MKIGVLSDSHGDINGLKRAINKMGNVDLLIHLGDHCRDAKIVEKEIGREIIYVKGNCDFNSDVECDKLINLDNKKIFITHGHLYNVKSDYVSLYYKALEEGVDIVLFGHTHYAEIFDNRGITFMNPGSITKSRTGQETYGVVIIEKGIIMPSIIELY